MKKPFMIFDMDGTLTDSMDYWYRLAEEYVTGLGFDYSPEVMEATAHLTVLDSAALFVERFGIPKTPEQAAADIDALRGGHTPRPSLSTCVCGGWGYGTALSFSSPPRRWARGRTGPTSTWRPPAVWGAHPKTPWSLRT